MLSPCLAPHSSLILSLSLWSFRVGGGTIVQVTNKIDVGWILVLQCFEEWCELDGVEIVFILYKGKTEWDIVLIRLFLQLADKMDVVNS